jgi:putative ABC transport system ATP-binding protein
MKLSLQKVLPTSINENLLHRSKIWLNEVVFESASKNIIEASSGTGKSTLIKLLTGVYVPKSGTVLYDDQVLGEMSKDDLCTFRKSSLSTVYQDMQLIDSLSGRENVLINFVTEDFVNQKLELLIEAFKMGDVIDHKTKTLSLGEQQRVAIIRAMAKPYQWLIMDEPFSHLDHENGQIAFDFILKDATEKNAGIIMTSLGNETFIHNLNQQEL